MWVSLGALFIKMAILLYTLPFKIFNDPKELWGPTYLCRPRFWKSLCRSAPTEEEAAGTGALNTSLETSLVRDSGEGTQIDLHDDEKKMIEQGFWEQPKHIPLSGTPYMRLDRINVEHNGHHLVHNLSLTAFPGEIIVLIGENGSGKSSMVRTIAGLEHVHSGTATAFGIDLFKAFRFMKDNFMTFTCTDPILIDLLTPEQHLHIFNSFLGLENDPKTIMSILSTYKLLSVAKIATIKLSRQNKKMLCFALAMLGNSKLVLLDDPMEGMDATQKRLV
jgi:ABC-type branched-subunit amino acid transport system ATPase component|mmetsp:Transcript_27850/g.37206  ORF Transcript_27850/g.37206 Transcript_27850/m.37206 type:complete len:277 (+) Transcript_27850:1380-2210(+)